jgi:uncharacterized Ntn-hydrolase superfamily protein
MRWIGDTPVVGISQAVRTAPTPLFHFMSGLVPGCQTRFALCQSTTSLQNPVMPSYYRLLCAALLVFSASCTTHSRHDTGRSLPSDEIIATYSIAAFDPLTGDLGVAVQSKFFSVGTVVPWAKAGVGAIATQAEANVRYGAEGLKLLEEKKSVEEIVKLLTEPDPKRESRQFGIVDAKGNSAAHTGKECFAYAGHITRKNYTVQGNILASDAVIKAMARAFEEAQQLKDSELADWLVAALQAGEDAGGDRRGRQSAAILVVREKAGYGNASDRYIDLRVEDHTDPTHELTRLLELHKRFHPSKHAARPVRKPGE